jgi:molybdopterin-guanine dinucleotide biosynthesis protein A
MDANTPLVVSVLAGGRSRRMGRDKTRLTLGGQTLIERVLAAAAPLGWPQQVLANQPELYADLPVPVHADLRPDLGPLAGLHTALTVAAPAAVLLLAGDLPFLTPAFLAFLVQLRSGWPAVVPQSPRGLQPLCAVYGPECLPAVTAALDRGDRRAQALAEQLRPRLVTSQEWQPYDPDGRLLDNVNTPEDYQAARDGLGEFQS